MKISALAQATGVTADTLRYYEKQHLLDPPARQDNGYRLYAEADIQRVRFIRSAQTLGFSLAEIRAVIPELVLGTFDRAGIEQRLLEKISQIDARFKELRVLKKELLATYDSLRCRTDAPVSIAATTRMGQTPLKR
jgi:DNA-binding transcriptional MerR regulator